MTEVNREQASVESERVAQQIAGLRTAPLERRLRLANGLLGPRPSDAASKRAPAFAPPLAPPFPFDGALASTCLAYAAWQALAAVSGFAIVPFGLLLAYVALVRPVAAIARASFERRLGRPSHRTAGSVASLAVAFVAALAFAIQRASGRSVSLAPGGYAFGMGLLAFAWLAAVLVGTVRREWVPEA